MVAVNWVWYRATIGLGAWHAETQEDCHKRVFGCFWRRASTIDAPHSGEQLPPAAEATTPSDAGGGSDSTNMPFPPGMAPLPPPS